MSLQRVVAYHAEPWTGHVHANDKIATEAERGIAELEAFLADAALATA